MQPQTLSIDLYMVAVGIDMEVENNLSSLQFTGVKFLVMTYAAP